MDTSRNARFRVTLIESTDMPHPTPRIPYDAGAWATTTEYPSVTFREVLGAVQSHCDAYRGRATVSGKKVGPNAYRWTWERLTSWGGRVSTTLWARPIENGVTP